MQPPSTRCDRCDRGHAGKWPPGPRCAGSIRLRRWKTIHGTLTRGSATGRAKAVPKRGDRQALARDIERAISRLYARDGRRSTELSRIAVDATAAMRWSTRRVGPSARGSGHESLRRGSAKVRNRLGEKRRGSRRAQAHRRGRAAQSQRRTPQDHQVAALFVSADNGLDRA